jgi:thiol:disulfide interchange protein
MLSKLFKIKSFSIFSFFVVFSNSIILQSIFNNLFATQEITKEESSERSSTEKSPKKSRNIQTCVYSDEKITIKLLSPQVSLRNGDFIYVSLDIKNPWHLTASDSEDSLVSLSRFDWSFKGEGEIEAEQPVWPKPESIQTPFGEIKGYTKNVLLKFKIKAKKSIPLNVTAVLAIKTSICSDTLCVPIQKELSFTFPLQESELCDAKNLDENLKQEKTTQLYFSSILLFAFLGGIFLNVMPCVLPVLSLKLLSLMKHRKKNEVEQDEEGRKQEKQPPLLLYGVAFLSGILLSFFILALIFLSFRSTLSWGFQLQSPIFVLFLILLFTIFALNLFGVFEMGTSLTRLSQILQPLQNTVSKKNLAKKDLFLTFSQGVLMAIVSTPCTGPFMGTALSVALSESALGFIFIFLSLGLGVGAPFFLFCAIPNSMRFIPKQGPWMANLKEFFGFCFLGTALWLSWVYGNQTSLDSLVGCFLGLLFLSLSLWFYGKCHYQRLQIKYALVALSLVSCGLAFFFLTESIPDFIQKSEKNNWKPYNEKEIKELEKKGFPYFIDFTAKWCLTCKMNHQLVLADKDIIDEFKKKKITLFLADYTSFDPAIQKALKSYKKAGIPVYVLFQGKTKIFLPEILTKDAVREALKF